MLAPSAKSPPRCTRALPVSFTMPVAEAHRAAAGAHHLLAFAIARHAHAGGADFERALFDHHIATKGGDLVGLIERALIGLDFNRAAAVALKRKSRRGGQ